MAVNRAIFDKLVFKAIDTLEGGYYHPLMLKDGRVTDKRYETSGETMYGLDRLNGAQLAKYSGWSQFWSTIDKANARTLWKWNYMGGTLASTLKSYVSSIMYAWYGYLSNKYLSPLSRSIVESDERILFNFIYACWNGQGFFKYYAGIINASTAKGITNKDILLQQIIDARKASEISLIRQTAVKIESIVKSLSSTIDNNKLVSIVFLLGVVGFGYYIYNKSN